MPSQITEWLCMYIRSFASKGPHKLICLQGPQSLRPCIPTHVITQDKGQDNCKAKMNPDPSHLGSDNNSSPMHQGYFITKFVVKIIQVAS